ncbi:MAG: 4-hydroxy-tetrahydrodipicolinate synthase [Actinomycetia bacterium]|nr:4-hydroxy-tetrahydrodipicolinate synthase [Actinomycetes bacterium]
MQNQSVSPAPFGRVLTAMVTPLDDNGGLDHAAAAQLAVDLVDLGNDGLVLNGTTGESPTTSDAEKAALIRTVVDAVQGRAVVVAGTGTNDTAHSIELSQQAVAAGADGLLLVTPYYNKPSQDGLIAHFRAVADATSAPVMLYDIPGRSAVALRTETLLRLAEHPRIVANKDAKGDPFAAQRVMSQSALVYYSGDDALNLPLLSVGASGFVSVVGHLVADRLAAMFAAYSSGDVAAAREISDSMVPIIVGVMTRAQGAVMVKAALDLLGRVGGGGLRLPLLAADPGQREQLLLDLKAGGFDL